LVTDSQAMTAVTLVSETSLDNEQLVPISGWLESFAALGAKERCRNRTDVYAQL